MVDSPWLELNHDGSKGFPDHGKPGATNSIRITAPLQCAPRAPPRPPPGRPPPPPRRCPQPPWRLCSSRPSSSPPRGFGGVVNRWGKVKIRHESSPPKRWGQRGSTLASQAFLEETMPSKSHAQLRRRPDRTRRLSAATPKEDVTKVSQVASKSLARGNLYETIIGQGSGKNKGGRSCTAENWKTHKQTKCTKTRKRGHRKKTGPS